MVKDEKVRRQEAAAKKLTRTMSKQLMEEEGMKTVLVGVSNEKEMGRSKSAESKS